MIDGLSNLDDVLRNYKLKNEDDRFNGIKIHEVNKTSKFRKWR